jgi:hypothetical protein
VKSVLLPTLLLVWGAIAFTWEGAYWNNSRSKIKDKNELPAKEMGHLLHSVNTKQIG